MVFSPGLEQLDPALLAFVKCHVTSPVKWEVLRVLASQEGAWTRADQLARRSHRRSCELTQAVAELAADGVVEILAAGAPEDVSYRLAGSINVAFQFLRQRAHEMSRFTNRHSEPTEARPTKPHIVRSSL